MISDIDLVPSIPGGQSLETPDQTAKFFDPTNPLENARLTNLSSYESAQTVMDTFNGKTDDDSQCYNRATMWTYEANILQNVNLGKIWIFFTRKYIRDYDYKWWFHVSPYAKVNDSMEKYVLDRGFTMIPYNVENWKNMFIKSKANCPVITDYRQYENNQSREHCYLIYSSQYYWQPYQLKNLATHGTTKSEYLMRDLEITYKDALIRWDGRIPRVRRDTTPVPRDPVPTPTPTPDRGRVFDIRVGDQVISSNGVEGRVTARLSNGLLEVQYVTVRYPIKQNPRDLAVTYGSSNGFYVGDRVLSRNGVRGYISGIYADGRVSVKYEANVAHLWQYTSDLRRIR